MNTIDFTQPGGFPLDQDVFGFQQANIAMAAQAANLAGPLAILAGCEVVGSNVGNGYVVIYGETLPFVGGNVATKVRIIQTTENMNYEDGEARPSQITRYATFGDDGVTTLLWADFKRNTSEGLIQRVEDLEQAAEDLGGDIEDLQNSRLIKIASGTMNLGNADPNQSNAGLGRTLTINLGKTLPNTNYMAMVSVVSQSANPQNDLYHQVNIRNKTVSSFDVYFREASVTVQNISLDWVVVAL